MWNWQYNVDTGLNWLENKRIAAQSYFNGIQRTYPNDWIEPPESYTVSNTSMTALEVATIQLYNGASVVRRLYIPGITSDEYGNIENLNEDQIDRLTQYYLSCWRFNQNEEENRWEFVTNSNNYVNSVITEYEEE